MFRRLLVASLLASLATMSPAQAAQYQWFWSVNGSLLQINYGTASNQPEYAVLDLNSGYMRFNYGPNSGWGTSIDVMPCYWSGGALVQGYPVTASAQTSGKNLAVTVTGSSNTLSTRAIVTISPPGNNSISASVSASTSGSVNLDNRPGEAFKPVFLSSMYDSPTVWDSQYAFVGRQKVAYPSASGWIVGPTPAVLNTTFGLQGGTSTWKTNAPTVTITFQNQVQVAGWYSADANPNDDNVGFWAASSTVLPSWSYKIKAGP